IRQGHKLFFAHAPFTVEHVFLNVFRKHWGGRSGGWAHFGAPIFSYILVSENRVKIECIIRAAVAWLACGNIRGSDDRSRLTDSRSPPLATVPVNLSADLCISARPVANLNVIAVNNNNSV